MATYTAPGTRPTLSGGTNVLRPAANSHVAGVDITGSGTVDAIEIAGLNRRVVIEDTNIRNAIDYGIFIAGINIDLKLRNSLIEQVGFGAVIAGSGNRIDLDDNTINASHMGIYSVVDAVVSLTNTTFEGTPSLSLIYLVYGNFTVTAGSAGNVNATINSADECALVSGATFTGTFGFDTGDFTQSNC